MDNNRPHFRSAVNLGDLKRPLGAPSSPSPSPRPAQSKEPEVEAYKFVSPGEPPLSRFAVLTRTGKYWSYPYAYVGLIECPSQDRVILHCTCGGVTRIEISGRGLRPIAEKLTAGRLELITEADNPAFGREDTVVAAVAVTP